MRSGYQVQGTPKLTVLSKSQREELHLATLEILERTGSRIFHEEALLLLEKAGADVSDSNLVRIPSSLIEWAIRCSPPRVTIFDRNGMPAMYLENGRTYFGTGSDCPNIIDHQTGQRRKFLKEDVCQGARLCDALPNIDFVMSMGLISDVPVETSDRHQFEAMVSNTTKPIVFTAHDLDGLRDIVDMAASVTGGIDKLRRNPFLILYGEPITPLKHAKESMDKLLFLAENRLPMIYAPGMLRGATAPVTTAGCLVMANAEALTGLLIAQLKREGAPVIYGGGAIPLDMRTSVGAYGAPELQVTGMALAEMAQYYRLPRFSGAGASDSKLPDQQAMIEGTISVYTQAMCGANLVHDVGFLESGLTSSYAMVVAMDEVIAMVKYIMSGITIDEETLALEVIHSVGPDGNFISDDHTLKHFRSGWFPRILDRRNYEDWAAAGGKSLGERLNERVSEVLSSHSVDALPDEVRNRLTQIIREAESQRK